MDEYIEEELKRRGFNDREIMEINFSGTYAAKYAHGTDGHTRLMIISKLFEILRSEMPWK